MNASARSAHTESRREVACVNGIQTSSGLGFIAVASRECNDQPSGKKDTNEAFLLVEALLARGTEPLPRVHTREDELFRPAGLEEVFRPWSTPAQRLELPIGAVTYLTGDLTEVAQRLGEYGPRFLIPDEIADQMPLYPKSLPSNAAKFKADTMTNHTRQPSPTAGKGVNHG